MKGMRVKGNASDSEPRRGMIRRYLMRASTSVLVVYAIVASFSTYFCMYAFRKPFAAAEFEGLQLFGTEVTLKTAIVISQIIGYALSKFIGIKVYSEVSAQRRAFALITLVLASEAALIAYGAVPGDWKVLAIFFNGLPLGMVWGMVVWYLEGRRTSELLLAGLSCSFILASGVVKDFGRALMEGVVSEWWAQVPVIGVTLSRVVGEVSEAWMPAVTGLHFLPLFLLSVWMLNQVPKPNPEDVEARVEREPMYRDDRHDFMKRFLFGMVLLCMAYFFLTAYRDFRDNYQVELFNGLGYPYDENQAIISKAELIVAFGVMSVLALLNLIKDNQMGLLGAYAVMTGGLVLMGGSTLLLEADMISGFWWMTLVGLGSYLAYIPYGSVLFDRLMASTRTVGTAVFAIYVADAIGYTGSIGVQLYKDLAQSEMSRLGFFKGFTYFLTIFGTFALVGSCVYFLRYQPSRATMQESNAASTANG